MKKSRLYLAGALILCLLVSQALAKEIILEKLNFNNADIRVVLAAIAELASKEGEQINIITSPEVQGLVNIDLMQVDWETALKLLLKTHGFAQTRYRNVILVAPLEKIKELEQQELEKQASEAPQLQVFNLKYIDANDAKKAVEPLLSKTGKTSVLETTGQGGWDFGLGKGKSRPRIAQDKLKRTKVLVISDVPSKLDQINTLIDKIDVPVKQILIKTRIMEVNNDLLKDIGFEWGTGNNGPTTISVNGDEVEGSSLANVTPSIFLPETTGLTPVTAGLELFFRHLNGEDFELLLHALEEDGVTNTLSAPVILALNNQEASIMVGTQFPIIRTEVSTQTNQIIGGTLEEYKDIGIQLSVVPQVWGENEDLINMIIHPIVSSSTTTSKVTTATGTILVEYPIIITREAETQLVVKDNETIVMGGLLKDVRAEQEIGVPFLREIPILGWFFKRKTYDTKKIDLLIFITAHIVNPGEEISEDIINTTNLTSQFKEKVKK